MLVEVLLDADPASPPAPSERSNVALTTEPISRLIVAETPWLWVVTAGLAPLALAAVF